MQKSFNIRRIWLASTTVCIILAIIASRSQATASSDEEARYMKSVNDAYWYGPNAEKIATALINLDDYYKRAGREHDINQALNFISTVPAWSHCGTLYMQLKRNTMRVANILRSQHKYALAEPLYQDVLKSQVTGSIEVGALEGYSELLHETGRADAAQPYESRAKKLISEEKEYESRGQPPRLW